MKTEVRHAPSWLSESSRTWRSTQSDANQSYAREDPRRAGELADGQTISVAFEGYALAKSGKRDEAKAALASLLKRSTERFIPPFHIALLFNGLGEHDQMFAWLERGYEQRDPKMTFLKVDPNGNNVRADPRFVNLMQRLGLAP